MRAAIFDPSLEARLGPRIPLRYSAGPDPVLDRPGHVRAGSGLVALGSRLVVIQDDAAFLAVIESESGRVEAIPLPAGPGGRRQFDIRRGNKMDKPDFEAAIPLGLDGLLAFGSGSAPGRDRVLQVSGIGTTTPVIAVHDAGPLYRALSALPALVGVGLNLEGAVQIGADTLRLFQRGNGAPVGDLRPVNASCDLSLRALLAWLEDPRVSLPEISQITAFDLGTIENVLLSFTDADAVEDGVVYLAAAEDTPNAVDDGPVVGVAVGIITAEGARWTLLRDERGQLVLDKAEGLVLDPTNPRRGWVVFDLDDPDRPTELAALHLEGPWQGQGS